MAVEFPARVRHRVATRRVDRPTLAVAALTVLALLARFALLGQRSAHFDEGRVAYWALEYLETGSFTYRFIIHGPLLQHVNAVVFALFGANDFTMRAFVALVGGLLPLVALLFRTRLRDAEVVALALFLAVNPVLLYYSRFSRSTILVAAFMTAALGCFLRAYDLRRPASLHAGALFVALGFASKENAVVYVLCWLGAGALLLDFALLAPRRGGSGFDAVRRTRDRVLDWARADRRDAARWVGHVALAVGLFLATALFFYAPRAGVHSDVGLWQAVGDPARLPAVVEATWRTVETGYGYWFGGSMEPGCNKETLLAGYECYLDQFVGTLVAYALPLCAFAVLGFLLERYATARPRALVMFAGYWGFASVLGYPLGTDIYGAWITVNALVPLAIPAAVGLATVVGHGMDALAADDAVSVGLAAVIVLLLAGQVAMTAADGVYLDAQSDENGLVQYAQPESDIRPLVRDIRAAGGDPGDGTDVLFYGPELTNPAGEGSGLAPACTRMVKTLPLHWYLRLADAQGGCAYDGAELDAALADGKPPVVVAGASHADELARRFEGSDRDRYFLRAHGREVVVFVDEDRLGERDGAAGGDSGANGEGGAG